MSSFAPDSRRPRRLRFATSVLCLLYLGVLLALWLILQWSDEWWPATFLMFSPRWVFVIPLALLLPAALLTRSRVGGVAVMAGFLVAIPATAFNIPLFSSSPEGNGVPFRVMTINMHHTKADPGRLDRFIEATDPDVVAIQEWPAANRADTKNNPGWYVHASSRLFLASRYPIRAVEELGKDSMGERASVTKYELTTPAGPVYIFSLHTASNREGLAEAAREGPNGPESIRANSDLRREQCAFIASQVALCNGPVLVMGDFNTPPESPILRDVLPKYTDAFGAAGWGWGYTFRSARTTAVRIDHVLSSPDWRVESCRVGPDVGSPHRPVVAELTLIGK